MDWEQAYKAVRVAFDSNNKAITLEQASAISYATLGIRVGGGPEQIVVLAGNEQSTLLWTSAARIALETWNGRIVRSSGFAFNLSGTMFRGNDPLATIGSSGGSANSSRYVDLPELNVYSVALDCEMTAAGAESTTILGQSIPTIRVNEHCHSAKLDWDFDNVFWVGQSSGFVWKSRQFISPKLPPLDIEVLRPPG